MKTEEEIRTFIHDAVKRGMANETVITADTKHKVKAIIVQAIEELERQDEVQNTANLPSRIQVWQAPEDPTRIEFSIPPNLAQPVIDWPAVYPKVQP